MASIRDRAKARRRHQLGVLRQYAARVAGVGRFPCSAAACDFSTLLAKGCKLSMDGCGAWRDHVFVERVWRSVKYERVYLKAYDSVRAARADIVDYFAWYNTARPCSSLDRVTPEQAYLDALPKLAKAA